MEAQLVACVRESLDAFLYDNAEFMCERLWAEYSSEVSTWCTFWRWRIIHSLDVVCPINIVFLVYRMPIMPWDCMQRPMENCCTTPWVQSRPHMPYVVLCRKTCSCWRPFILGRIRLIGHTASSQVAQIAHLCGSLIYQQQSNLLIAFQQLHAEQDSDNLTLGMTM